ncbi:AAA family ATPase [Herbidospora sp. NBRC 101105]|uniref:AAA family ATPase n=1 Tax=Herbidospora sp. NBRC 101105 TaxID=3032195 RepID=UPI0024A23C7B|nr:AAA family ATPase [Herbidospora sp. NBRC 101105]GLX96750.1 ATPase [Herbidospora sp. NBRC 101105]
MAGQRLSELRVENFRSLREVALPLGPVNVLVGPNGAGKTNVLEVFRFLADVVRTDLGPALERRGGFGRLAFRGGAAQPAYIQIGITGSWSPQQSTRPDEYTLRIAGSPLAREEIFRSGAYPHRLRTITVLGETARAKVVDEPYDPSAETPTRHIGLEDHGDGADSLSVGRGDEVEEIGIQPLSSGLSTLPRLSSKGFSMEPMRVAALLGSFRIFDVDVARACLPSRVAPGYEPILADASNLAGFLLRLRDTDSDAWERLQADAVEVLPQLESLDFDYPSGGAHSVVVVLRERGLRETTPLLDASFGTIRLLGLLAMLYDPDPPALTCVEEIDHGLHPQALELLMERIREASEKTQFIIATHSPALADRLKPEEIVICERGDDGSSLIPAVSTAKVEEIVRASEGLPLGELWFSGVLGGDL